MNDIRIESRGLEGKAAFWIWLCARCFLSDWAVMSGPGDVIHMAAVSGCLTPRLDRYYPTTIVLENNQALALTFCIPIPKLVGGGD